MWEHINGGFNMIDEQIKNGEITTLTWEELLASSVTNVIVQSYGYEDRSLFIAPHWEPFGHLTDFNFTVRRADQYSSLDHPWLMLDEPEEELIFNVKDGKVYLFDPELWAQG